MNFKLHETGYGYLTFPEIKANMDHMYQEVIKYGHIQYQERLNQWIAEYQRVLKLEENKSAKT